MGIAHRAGNVGAAPWRMTVGTAANSVSDAAETVLITPVSNIGQWLAQTKDDIVANFATATNTGKWYQKIVNTWLATIYTPFKAVEWVCRTVLNTWWNIASAAKHTVANTGLNFFSWLSWFGSDKNPFDFTYKGVQRKPISQNSWWFSPKWMRGAGWWSSQKQSQSADTVPMSSQPEKSQEPTVVAGGLDEESKNLLKQLVQKQEEQDAKNAEYQKQIIDLQQQNAQLLQLLSGTGVGLSQEEDSDKKKTSRPNRKKTTKTNE